MVKIKLLLPTSTYNQNSTDTNTFTTYHQQKTKLTNNNININIASVESYRTDSIQHIDTINMTNKILSNNSICELHSANPRSPTINNIQPPSLRSPPLLTKTNVSYHYQLSYKYPSTSIAYNPNFRLPQS